MISTLATRLVTIYRRTAYVVDVATAAQTMTVARQPVRESLLRVEVLAGQAGSGTIGLLGSAAETLTFSANGPQTTVATFTSLSSVTTAGLTNESPVPTVSVQAVDRAGNPQAAEHAVATSIPAAYSPARGSWPVQPSGSQAVEEAIFGLDTSDVYVVQIGDVLQEDASGARWLVTSTEDGRGTWLQQMRPVRCVRLQT